jgi:sulfur-oxidizing protein SoxZ
MSRKIKVQIRIENGLARVKSLIVHPMETGSRKDQDTGELVPRHHIEQVTYSNNGKTVLLANCSTAVSRNPTFNFSFKNAKPGDHFKASWVDTRGETDSLEMVLKS